MPREHIGKSETEPEDALAPSRLGEGPRRQRIGVVGNLNADLIFRNVAALPRWGEEVEAGSHLTASAGQAGYLAMGLARLDAEVILIGLVGDDYHGRRLLEDLRAAGVSVTNVRVSPTARTGVTVAMVRPDGERSFVSDFGASREVDGMFLAGQDEALSECDVVCLVGLFNLPSLRLEDARSLLGSLRRAGIETMLDTGWDPRGWSESTVAGAREVLSEVDVFMPNFDECRALIGEAGTPESCAADLQRLGPHTVIVKCGAEGSCGRAVDESATVGAVPATPYDAVGAGDMFDAGYLRARGGGARLREAMTFASAAAAHYISRAVDRFPSTDDVNDLLTASRTRKDQIQ
jgi:argininosuccinate lyase